MFSFSFHSKLTEVGTAGNEVEKLLVVLDKELQALARLVGDSGITLRAQLDKIVELDNFVAKKCTKLQRSQIYVEVVSELREWLATYRTLVESALATQQTSQVDDDAQHDDDELADASLLGHSLFSHRRALAAIYRLLSSSSHEPTTTRAATPGPMPDWKEALELAVTEKRRLEQSLGTLSAVHAVYQRQWFEVDCLARLLQLQLAVSKLQYMDAVLLLNGARKCFDSWRAWTSGQISGASSAVSAKAAATVSPFAWLHGLFLLLQSKMHVYFFRHAVDDETGEIKSGDARLFGSLSVKVEVLGMIESFFFRTDAYAICVLADMEQLGCGPAALGYECSSGATKRSDASSSSFSGGIRQRFHPVFSCPPSKEAPLDHWPNIVSVIFDNTEFLDKYREVLCFYDKKVATHYFLSKIDPQVYFVVLYMKRKEKKEEKTIRDHISAIVNSLRLFKLLHQLH